MCIVACYSIIIDVLFNYENNLLCCQYNCGEVGIVCPAGSSHPSPFLSRCSPTPSHKPLLYSPVMLYLNSLSPFPAKYRIQKGVSFCSMSEPEWSALTESDLMSVLKRHVGMVGRDVFFIDVPRLLKVFEGIEGPRTILPRITSCFSSAPIMNPMNTLLSKLACAQLAKASQHSPVFTCCYCFQSNPSVLWVFVLLTCSMLFITLGNSIKHVGWVKHQCSARNVWIFRAFWEIQIF